MNHAPYLSGQLLLALPGMGDPRFRRAVIALCVHDEEGALGIGIGALLGDLTLHALLAQVDIDPGVAPDAPVHWGGPVEPSRGFVLHSTDWGGQDTILVGMKWAFTGTLDILRAISEGKGPRQWVVALGYAGWGAGQLDEEMTRHGWLTAKADPAVLFDTAADARWNAALRTNGIDPRLLSSSSGTA
ncbi:MAG: UPF0301 protein YqgE [uncultured Sphingomonas sp.]|uniref:UPF0301 protein AVDCRST_MAG31-1425 n=2 Tax=uncultured Sphingomonas sp. TaxID=158754 RepID=A0A6J4TBZ4_9SPHN|nr:MAG: UPF0301 protein YqgE [uncultured Sphingomonas sp.]